MPTIHRNLNRGGWTIKESSSAPAKPVYAAIAHGITVKQPSGKKFTACRQEGAKRAVFAWFKCETVSELSQVDLRGDPTNALTGVIRGSGETWSRLIIPGGLIYENCEIRTAERVRFNPKTDDCFHIDGERVDTLRMAIFLPNGECWGVR